MNCCLSANLRILKECGSLTSNMITGGLLKGISKRDDAIWGKSIDDPWSLHCSGTASNMPIDSGGVAGGTWGRYKATPCWNVYCVSGM